MRAAAFLAAGLVLGAAVGALAAEPAPSSTTVADDRPRVFLDCVEDCFQAYVRTEVAFVDYVRDPADADVHVIVSTQGTGAGGREYALRFVGHGRFASMNEVLRYASEKDEPEERVRRGFVQALKLGLVRYAAQTGMGARLGISLSEGGPAVRTPKDTWKSWVFSARGYGELEGEESARKYSLEGALSADRVTPDWKISLGATLSHEEESYDVDDREVVSTKLFRIGEGLAIKSLGPHWSVGGHAAVWKNTFENTRAAAGGGPMLEYSLHPYDQHTRRQLRFSYRLELRDMHYVEETVFERTDELLWREELEVNLQRREPWGSIEGEAELSHYLHDVDRYRLDLRLEASLRLFQGLSLNLGAEGSRVRDQLSLPRRGATPEEILLEQRQLASGFRYEFDVGLTYTFGSIYNNVVNPRFGD